MKSIDESLDYILEELMKNWDVSRPEDRLPLMCEPTMVYLGFADRFRKHEFFIRLINRLIKDGYADHIDPHERNDLIKNPSLINFYEKNTIITVEGYYVVIDKKGYVKQTEINAENENRKDYHERHLLYGTWGVAIGAIALVVWEAWKLFYVDHPELHFPYYGH